MNVLDVFDRPIAFHRSLVRIVGSVPGALMLSQAIYWQARCTSKDGWWWKTTEDWQSETGLTRREIETARKCCEKYLRVTKRGIPCKCYYKVLVDNVRTSLAESAKQVCTKTPNKYGGNRQTKSTETTAETTTETTSKDESDLGNRTFPSRASKEEAPERKPSSIAALKDWAEGHPCSFGPDSEERAMMFVRQNESNGWPIRAGWKKAFTSFNQHIEDSFIKS